LVEVLAAIDACTATTDLVQNVTNYESWRAMRSGTGEQTC